MNGIEYYDLLNEQGNPLGSSKPKPEVHKDGDWHKTAHVWIMNSKAELLIQKRHSTKDAYPGLWDISAAGHLSAGDTSIQGALRETEEELGINLNPENIEYLFTAKVQEILNDGTYINNEFQDVYLVTLDKDASEFKIQADEVSELKFIPFKELEGLVIKSEDFVPHPEEYKRLFAILHGRFV